MTPVIKHDSGFKLTFMLSSLVDIEVDERTATLNQDFAVDDLVAYFGDGEANAAVTLSIINSPEVESTEVFTAVLNDVEGGNAVLGFPTRTDVTILDESGMFFILNLLS